MFTETVAHLSMTWEAVGFYSPDGKVYAFGTDTKVISTVFEALAAPIIKSVADRHDYVVEGSAQTVYPDFTLSPKTALRNGRIAVDIKTTYRRLTPDNLLQPFRFTLGSFTSFLRGGTKNIKYPYQEYSDHWVIGFLYTRRPGVASKVYYTPTEVNALLCPYSDVEYFVQEKYKIVGETPASGNTTNIGSFPASLISELTAGNGPFAALGKELCDEYWRNFAKTAAAREYSNVGQFLAWLEKRNAAGA
jgi:hypothetical protein